jgi:rhodanese-related sulfurtransferase
MAGPKGQKTIGSLRLLVRFVVAGFACPIAFATSDEWHRAPVLARDFCHDAPCIHCRLLWKISFGNKRAPAAQNIDFMQHKVIFLILCALTLASCSQSQTTLTASQVENLLKSDPSSQLVDVRTPAEWQASGVIEGAKRINFHAPDFQAQMGKLDKDKPVIVYCAAGGRSPVAAEMLLKMGFKKVFDYPGGMNDWKAKGKKTVH